MVPSCAERRDCFGPADAWHVPKHVEMVMTGESILIVKDEGFIALQIEELLEKNGYGFPVPQRTGRTPW